MRAVVVLSGDPPPASAWAACEGALVVAADGGANHCADAGRRPAIVVGDMDSARADVLREFERAGVEVRRHPARKAFTDGTLALDEALARGARDVTLLAATGGRLDHEIASLALLVRGAAAGARMRMSARGGTLTTVTAATPLDLDLPRGTTVSVLALTDRAGGVAIAGFEWPLRDATLESAFPLGASNVVAAAPQRVECASGVLAVVVPGA